MEIKEQSVLITGGASGLGLTTARALAHRGALVTIADLPQSNGADVARELAGYAQFVPADITDPEQVSAAAASAAARAPLRALVHTAGRGGPVRLIDKEGNPGDLTQFEAVVRTNLVGTFNVASIAAAEMAKNEPVQSQRGVLVLTASVAAYEGQIGQTAYAASKAGVVGMTIVAARDLANRGIRVNTIAPGIMDTPMLGRLRADIRASLAATVPNPARLGAAEEYASLVAHIIDNGYINGETIRLDGALRMAPR